MWIVIFTLNLIIKLSMEKLKLKPIDPLAQTKKEARPVTPGFHKYPADMRYRLLAGLCKSGALAKLAEDVASLTRAIKTQKPLTLKPSKYSPAYR